MQGNGIQPRIPHPSRVHPILSILGMIRTGHPKILITPRQHVLARQEQYRNLLPLPRIPRHRVERLEHLPIDGEVQRVHGHLDRGVDRKSEQSPRTDLQALENDGEVGLRSGCAEYAGPGGVDAVKSDGGAIGLPSIDAGGGAGGTAPVVFVEVAVLEGFEEGVGVVNVIIVLGDKLVVGVGLGVGIGTSCVGSRIGAGVGIESLEVGIGPRRPRRAIVVFLVVVGIEPRWPGRCIGTIGTRRTWSRCIIIPITIISPTSIPIPTIPTISTNTRHRHLILLLLLLLLLPLLFLPIHRGHTSIHIQKPLLTTRPLVEKQKIGRIQRIISRFVPVVQTRSVGVEAHVERWIVMISIQEGVAAIAIVAASIVAAASIATIAGHAIITSALTVKTTVRKPRSGPIGQQHRSVNLHRGGISTAPHAIPIIV
mmetsp:Transcript_4728/g.10437  ORF Transcript_4728/g.10437 Transcript_4728/m.10437 type:complete len:426 (-) Transcript_4728:1296-2573(-)